MDVLVEIHAHYRDQSEMPRGRLGLRLRAAAAGPTRDRETHRAPLKQWLEMRPRNTVTVLDTHDGIGMVESARSAAIPSSRASYRRRDGIARRNHSREQPRLEPTCQRRGGKEPRSYQMNCTFYDALARDDRST